MRKQICKVVSLTLLQALQEEFDCQKICPGLPFPFYDVYPFPFVFCKLAPQSSKQVHTRRVSKFDIDPSRVCLRC